MNATYAAFLKQSAKQRARIVRMREADPKTGKPRHTLQAIADQFQISCQRVHKILKEESEKAKAAS